ncbi:5873_t:CDS:1, partial [Racocetra fulgida]
KKGKETSFLNKTDRIVQHLKNCIYFVKRMTVKERAEIFALSINNEETSNKKQLDK